MATRPRSSSSSCPGSVRRTSTSRARRDTGGSRGTASRNPGHLPRDPDRCRPAGWLDRGDDVRTGRRSRASTGSRTSRTGATSTILPRRVRVPLFADATGSVRVVAAGPVVADARDRPRNAPACAPLTRSAPPDRARWLSRSRRASACYRGLREDRVSDAVDNRAEDHGSGCVRCPGADDTSTVRAKATSASSNDRSGPLERHRLARAAAADRAQFGLRVAGDLVVFGRGLPEYEATLTPAGLDLALTLLRCVGGCPRDDLSTRPGSAGPTLATPRRQCPGEHTFEYAIVIANHRGPDGCRDAPSVRGLPHGADDRAAGAQTRGCLGAGDVVVTALKGAEDAME